jgi:UDP-glucose 4-epimerase
MKYLVTGGAGFIGSNIVNRLVDSGQEVVVIDNESSEGHKKPYWNKKAKNYKKDICDYSDTRKLYKDVDYVFHLAAESRIQQTIKNPIKATLVNTLGTNVVLQCSKEAGVKRVVYSSTSSAYGNNKSPNIETQNDDCLNPYSVSKVAGEKLCKIYTDLFELETVILRYFNVYGNNQPLFGQYSLVTGIFERQKINNEPLTIVGDGEQKRDFVNVLDVVEANIAASQKDIDKKYLGTVFNVGSGKNYSINEIAKLYNHPFIYIPQREGEMKETLANVEKAKTVLNWSATIDLKNWLQDRV